MDTIKYHVEKFLQLEENNFISVLVGNKYIIYYFDDEEKIWKEDDNNLIISIAKYNPLFTNSQIKHIYNALINSIKKSIFDDKWWLLNFENGVYDLNESKFRERKSEDYIELSTGYPYIEPMIDDLNFMNNILDKTFPNKEIRDFILTVASTSLEGKKSNKIYMMKSYNKIRADNGKSIFMNFLQECMGQYSYTIHSEMFTINKYRNMNYEKQVQYMKNSRLISCNFEEINGDINTDKIKNMFFNKENDLNKCTVLFQVYDDTSFIKDDMNGRYSHKLNKPDVEYLPFISSFVNNEPDDTDKIDYDYTYKRDPSLCNLMYDNKYRCAFMKILMDYYKKYKDNNYSIQVPDIVKSLVN